MRHAIIAGIIGVGTILLLIWVSGNNGASYESDIDVSRSVELGSTFEAASYNITPLSFACGDYTSSDQEYTGCVLEVALRNTTDFEIQLNLDGDRAVTADGTTYESDHELCEKLIPDNQLTKAIEPDQEVEGGIFFEMPDDVDVQRVEIYESVNTPAIEVIL